MVTVPVTNYAILPKSQKSFNIKKLALLECRISHHLGVTKLKGIPGKWIFAYYFMLMMKLVGDISILSCLNGYFWQSLGHVFSIRLTWCEMYHVLMTNTNHLNMKLHYSQCLNTLVFGWIWHSSLSEYGQNAL